MCNIICAFQMRKGVIINHQTEVKKQENQEKQEK